MNDLSIITTEDGSHSLFNKSLNETYHSIHGAIRESDHVFIRAGLDHWLSCHASEKLRILEIGFGTGLNTFLTAIHPVTQMIHYESLDAFPITNDLAMSLNYGRFRESEELFSSIVLAPWNQETVIHPTFTLLKLKADVISDEIRPGVDIIYYDAFGPSKQPEMWTKEVLTKVTACLNANGIFVTYCAKGQVKRDLKSLGLTVETLPGPPGKLQMIRATREAGAKTR